MAMQFFLMDKHTHEPVHTDGMIEFKVVDKESGEIEIAGDRVLMISLQQMTIVDPSSDEQETKLDVETKEGTNAN